MKRTVRILALALALLSALCACGETGGVSFSVYREVSPFYLTTGELVAPEQYAAEPGVGIINTVIAAFNSQPEDRRLRSPLPADTRILGYTLEGRAMRLEVSPGYAGLEGVDKSVADCCIALTFCDLAGVGTVSVWSEGQELTAPLSADDIFLPDAQ